MADNEDEPPVTLFSRFGKVYVWNADDAFKLRSKYRIVGSLIGSLPRKPKQNHCFSVPLLLSQEEVTLLLDKGLARIFNMPKVFPAPSKEEVERFNELRRDSVIKQTELFQRGREEKQMELAEVIEEGRRRKRKRKKGDGDNDDEGERLALKKMKSEKIGNEGCKTKKEGECNQSNDKCNEDNNVMKRYQDETCSSTEVYPANSETLPTVNTVEQESKIKGDMSINVAACSDITSEETKPSSELGTLTHIPTIMPQRMLKESYSPMDWTYPQTQSDKLRYKVFLDLWERGYYLTSGAKFGGDLLAYPGDPMRYHSFYIVIIIPWDKKITPFQIISAGRLGATVKKTALFCSVDDNTGDVVYTSVKWSGIS